MTVPLCQFVPKNYDGWVRLRQSLEIFIEQLFRNYKVDEKKLDREKYKSWRLENHHTQPFLDGLEMLWEAIPAADKFSDDPVLQAFFILFMTRHLAFAHQKATPEMTVGYVAKKMGIEIDTTYG